MTHKQYNVIISVQNVHTSLMFYCIRAPILYIQKRYSYSYSKMFYT